MPEPLEQRIKELERRLERLERLAFLGFQDTRDVARYAYENLRLDIPPDQIKRLPANFSVLSDRELIELGVSVPEIASLKSTMRILRKQVRRDALGIVRDMMQRGKKEVMQKKAA